MTHHTWSYFQHSRHLSVMVGSSNSPCNRSGSLTGQCEQTNSLRNDGSKEQAIGWGRSFRNTSDSGMAFQLLDSNHFPPRSQIHHTDNSNSENDHVKTHHIKRPWHDHLTNGTRGFCDSMGLLFPRSTPFSALSQQKSKIHNSQGHVHERFGVNERNSGKRKNWYRCELTRMFSAWPNVLFRFVPSRAPGIQRPRARMAFVCPISSAISSDQ